MAQDTQQDECTPTPIASGGSPSGGGRSAWIAGAVRGLGFAEGEAFVRPGGRAVMRSSKAGVVQRQSMNETRELNEQEEEEEAALKAKARAEAAEKNFEEGVAAVTASLPHAARLAAKLMGVDRELVESAYGRAVNQDEEPASAGRKFWALLRADAVHRHTTLMLGWYAEEAGLGDGADLFIGVVMDSRHAEGRTKLLAHLAGEHGFGAQVELVGRLMREIMHQRGEGAAGDSPPSAAMKAGGTEAVALRNMGSWYDQFKALPAPEGEVKDLQGVIAITEFWSVGLHAYLDAAEAFWSANLSYSIALAQKAEAEIDKRNGAGQDIIGLFSDRAKDLQESAEGSLESARSTVATCEGQLAQIRGGTTVQHELLATVAQINERARTGLDKLKPLEQQTKEPDPEQVKIVAAEALLDLDWCLGQMQAAKQGVSNALGQIDDLKHQAAELEAAASEIRTAMRRATLEALWDRASTALGTFNEGLKKVDWIEVLEIGLEIAGTVISGGALLAGKIVLWVARVGDEVLTLKSVTDPAVAIYGALSDESVGKAMGSLFSGPGLAGALGGLLFGQNPIPDVPPPNEAAAKGAEGAAAKNSDPKAKGEGGLAGVIGWVAGLAAKAYRGFIIAVDWVNDATKSADLRHYPWFASLGGMIASILEVTDRIAAFWEENKDRVNDLVGQLGQQLQEFIGGARNTVSGILDKLAALDSVDPAGVAGEVVGGFTRWLMDMFIRRNPSAALRKALAIGGVTSETLDEWSLKIAGWKLSQKIGEKLAQTDLVGGMSKRVSSALGKVAGAGSGMKAAVDGVEAQAQAATKSGAALVEKTVGVNPEGKKEKDEDKGAQPGKKGGGGPVSDAFLSSLKHNLIEFAEASSATTSVVKGASRGVTGADEKGQDKGLGKFYTGLKASFSKDGNKLLGKLKTNAAGSLGYWGDVVRSLAGGVKPLMGLRVDADAVEVKFADGKASSLVMPTESWIRTQKLFLAAAGLNYLTAVNEPFMTKTVGDKRVPLKGLSGLREALQDETFSRMFLAGFDAACDGINGETVFGATKVGTYDVKTLETKTYIRFEAEGDDLYLGGAPLPTRDRDPDGVRMEALGKALAKRAKGNAPDLVKFLLAHGGWERVGKQLGPGFAPEVRDWRTDLCKILKERFGAHQTGSAKGFTSDEDLNFFWSDEDNRKGNPPGGPAARITQAEWYMEGRFGPKWGHAFDIAFQLPAENAHLYSELEEGDQAALSQEANEAANAVNIERLVIMGGGHGEKPKWGDKRVVRMLGALGLSENMGGAMATLESHRYFLMTVPQLRAEYDELLGRWHGDRPKEKDALRALVSDIVFCQLALARKNDEAYASPGGVKTTVTKPILEGQLNPNPKEGAPPVGAEREELEGKKAKVEGFSVHEAHSSALEDLKNFELQSHLGDHRDYPRLSVLVTGFKAAAEANPHEASRAEGKDRDKDKDKDAVTTDVTPGQFAEQDANLAAAAFRYNLYKYAYRLIKLLTSVQSAQVKRADGQGPLELTGVPFTLLNKWLSGTNHVYAGDEGKNRMLYDKLVEKRNLPKGEHHPLDKTDVKKALDEVKALELVSSAVVEIFKNGKQSGSVPWKRKDIKGPQFIDGLVTIESSKPFSNPKMPSRG